MSQSLAPGSVLRGIVVAVTTDQILSVNSDNKDCLRKILVRVPEIHNYDEKSPDDIKETNKLIPLASVQLPPDISGTTSSSRDFIDKSYGVGDIVYVQFPTGDPSNMLVTGLLCKAAEAQIESSKLLAPLVDYIVSEFGIEYTTVSSSAVVSGRNYNIFYSSYFGLPMNEEDYYVSSPYGLRKIEGEEKGHGGVDLSGGGFAGKPVYSVGNGTVTTVVNGYPKNSGYYGCDDGGGYGNYVIVDHGTIKGKNYKTVYAHLNATSVKVGQKVVGSAKGAVATQVGLAGHTGSSTGAHLHFEVRVNDERKDPENYIKLR